MFDYTLVEMNIKSVEPDPQSCIVYVAHKNESNRTFKLLLVEQPEWVTPGEGFEKLRHFWEIRPKPKKLKLIFDRDKIVAGSFTATVRLSTWMRLATLSRKGSFLSRWI